MKKNAIIAGVTGLVGNLCLEKLHAKQLYNKITAVTRKTLRPSILGVENVVINFDEIEKYSNQLTGDHAFCALGTTIHKAGSKEAFRKVDFEYALRFANIAKQNGAQKFILVSAIGADANSNIFYSKVKGELESELEKLGFDSLIIMQPSLLLGDRKELRAGEIIGKGLSLVTNFALWGPLEKYKAIEAETVAESMIHYASAPTPKVLRLTYKNMVNLN
jgi:uncharacterized protein YbjT (DUF2867 family)